MTPPACGSRQRWPQLDAAPHRGEELLLARRAAQHEQAQAVNIGGGQALEHRDDVLDAARVLVAPVRALDQDADSAPMDAGRDRAVLADGLADAAIAGSGHAEVLAELVPQIAATTVAAPYADEPLQSLMAATYEAFRRRRSLLLLDLERQVAVDELPWVQAVAHHRSAGADAIAGAMTAVVRLAELAIDAFPATIIPSPLVSELDTLARAAGLRLPLVEELAADIFMGTFSAKFLHAAKLAGRLLSGSLYERYYAIDYAQILTIDDVGGRRSPRLDVVGV